MRSEPSRVQPRMLCSSAIDLLALAFNARGLAEFEYRYDGETCDRVSVLAKELRTLIEHGEVLPNAAHLSHLRAQAARRDPAVQLLIKRASRKTPIR